ncbi:MAG TPA: isocitrate lyase/PEP mutase family protein [Beijerinckiaceae bacterium]|jgi:2-methylisocitrate lyase-like PEP mutase family enzyme
MRLRPQVIQGKASTELRRQLREDERPLISIGGATPHHAQLAEATGFRLFGLSGSQASAHILGLPDAGLMTMSEVVDNARRVCRAVSIPVIADCETGFGNVLNATRAVSELIDAGVAGLFIEDQVFPKRCGFTNGVQIIPAAEAVGKLRAAIAVRDNLDPDVVILARTDSRACVGGSVDEVLRRCEAYLAAGVDMMMITALQSREEIRRVREAFPEALLKLNISISPPLTEREFRDFRISIYDISISKIAQMMMFDFLTKLRRDGIAAFNEFTQSHKDHQVGMFGFLELTGFPKLLEIEREFLGAEALDKYDSSIGLFDPRAKKAAGA